MDTDTKSTNPVCKVDVSAFEQRHQIKRVHVALASPRFSDNNITSRNKVTRRTQGCNVG